MLFLERIFFGCNAKPRLRPDDVTVSCPALGRFEAVTSAGPDGLKSRNANVHLGNIKM